VKSPGLAGLDGSEAGKMSRVSAAQGFYNLVDGAIELVGCVGFGNAALTGDGFGEIKLLHAPEG
jgi:hypothetical protein